MPVQMESPRVDPRELVFVRMLSLLSLCFSSFLICALLAFRNWILR